MFYFNYDNLQRHQSSKGPLHSIPPYLIVQCGSAYAQHGECSPFSLNPPARLLQRPLDIPFFEIRQRRVSGKQLFGHSPSFRHLDIFESLGMLHRFRKRQVPPPGQDDRLLDDVAQLAYIPRPTQLSRIRRFSGENPERIPDDANIKRNASSKRCNYLDEYRK